MIGSQIMCLVKTSEGKASSSVKYIQIVLTHVLIDI